MVVYLVPIFSILCVRSKTSDHYLMIEDVVV